MADLTVKSSASTYITTGGTSPVAPFPGTQVSGDVVVVVGTTNDNTRLLTGTPAGWTLLYNVAFGTASRFALWKTYASGDGTGLTLPFSAQPAMQVSVIVLDGTVYSGLGTIGTATARASSVTTITAAAAGTTGAPSLVIAHEKASSHPSLAVASPTTTTIQNVTNAAAASAAQYIGSYDTAGGTAARTITYGTASSNGVGLQIPVVTVAVTIPSGTGTGASDYTGSATGTAPSLGIPSGSGSGTSTYTGSATGDAPGVPSTVTLAQVSNTIAGSLRSGWWVTNAGSVRMAASLSPSFTSPIYSGNLSIAASGGCTGTVTGLAADTVYYIGLEVDGVLHASGRATARTINPARVNGSTVWATGSCNYTGSNHVVLDRIRALFPRFFVHQGDRHYADTSVESTWRAAMKSSMTSARALALAAEVPLTWDPDNHDWGGNRTWRTSPIAAIVPVVMRETTGDYAHATGFYRTWVDHGIQHVEIDRWSFRDKDIDGTSPDGDSSAAKGASDPTKVMLGATQEAWLLDILANSTATAIIVYSGFPLTDSRFAPFQAETTRIRNAIAALPAEQRYKIIAVGGDSHDIRANSGTSKSVWGVPTLNASGLDQTGAAFDTTGWDIGIISPVDTGRGYFSLLTATDNLSTMTVKWDAVRDDGTVLMTWSRTFASPVGGSGSGTSTYSGSAAGSTLRQGSGAGNSTYSGAAAGSSARQGTATGTSTYAGTATGTSVRGGTATGTSTYAGTASGSTTRGGTASGTSDYSGSATGFAPVVGGKSGTGSGTSTYTGTATGSAPVLATRSGSGTGTSTYVGTATGSAPVLTVPKGSGSGTSTYAGTATGSAPVLVMPTGQGSGNSVYVGSGSGFAPGDFEGATWRRWDGTKFVSGGTMRRWTGAGWDPPVEVTLN